MMNKLFPILLLTFLAGCRKESDLTVPSGFQHTYPLPGNERTYALTSVDEGFLMVGSKGALDVNDENSIVLITTDKAGKLISYQTIENDSFFIPWVSKQNDGSLLICPNELGRHFYKLDKSGNIQFKSRFTPRSFFSYFSLPMVKADGNYVIAANSYTFQNDEFLVFDHNGNFLRSLRIILPDIVRAADHLCLYHTEDSATYYYYGIERPIAANYNPRIFIARQTYSGSVLKSGKALKVDNNNTSAQNFPDSRVNLNHLLLGGNEVLLYNTQLDAGGSYKGYLALIDKDLNKVWEKDLKITNAGTSPKCIIRTMDGNLLVVGSCNTLTNKMEQPFMCKMDLEGNILSSKVFPLQYSGSFNTVIQLTQDQLLFGGTTNGYGRGLNLNDMFILKTDAAGNLLN